MKQARAFTLIELLVVVAIIALLLSVLMPSLSRARDQARDTVCRKNLSSVGTVCQTYAASNKDRYPEHINGWPNMVVDPYNPVNGRPLLTDRTKGKIYSSHLVNTLNPYVGEPKVFYCPLKYIPVGWANVTGPDDFAKTNYGYHTGWNGLVDGKPNPGPEYRFVSYLIWFGYTDLNQILYNSSGVSYYSPNKKVSKIHEGNSLVGLASDVASLDSNANVDPKTYQFVKNPPRPEWQPLNHPWTVGGINALFGDFHVEKRRWENLQVQVRVSGGMGPNLFFFW